MLVVEVGVSLKGNELVNCAPDGLNGRPRTSRNAVMALHGRPRAMTSGGGWRRVRCEGL